MSENEVIIAHNCKDLKLDNLFIIIQCYFIQFFLIFLFFSVLKAAVIVIFLMIRVSSACCFTGQFIMIGNLVASHLKVAVHGLSTSTVCGARYV